MAEFTITKVGGDTKGRYETAVDGHRAELTYSRLGSGAIIADHTGVPDAMRGMGVGQALVAAMMADLRSEGRKVVPLCPFVTTQFRRHHEWADLNQ